MLLILLWFSFCAHLNWIILEYYLKNQLLVICTWRIQKVYLKISYLYYIIEGSIFYLRTYCCLDFDLRSAAMVFTSITKQTIWKYALVKKWLNVCNFCFNYHMIAYHVIDIYPTYLKDCSERKYGKESVAITVNSFEKLWCTRLRWYQVKILIRMINM